MMANGTRRDFFSSMVDGLHGTALATLLGADLFSAAGAPLRGRADLRSQAQGAAFSGQGEDASSISS